MPYSRVMRGRHTLSKMVKQPRGQIWVDVSSMLEKRGLKILALNKFLYKILPPIRLKII
ncbi:hypothetical protein CO2235_200092 [Cupriavidus oxalaticus]|uniref:Uncharacterized protein n=1 Tax=Cupriavidus oxalaticus TaxID=96344 RepID=A0A976BCX7_9BURK|nr:hypothetical protein CO2235_200092 [Cupriavidus oxalaticus]